MAKEKITLTQLLAEKDKWCLLRPSEKYVITLMEIGLKSAKSRNLSWKQGE